MSVAISQNNITIPVGSLRVVILTEGGPNIGFGHVMRCAALADALRKQGCQVSIYINAPVNSCSLRQKSEVVYANWLTDSRIREHTVEGADLLVLDSYQASQGVVQELARGARKMVVIDDNNRMPYPDEVIIVNPNLAGDTFNYSTENADQLLCGISYALLRPEFSDQRKHEYRKEIEHVVVTLGGSTQSSRLVTICKALRSLFPSVSITMIVSNAIDRLALLDQLEGPPIAVLQDLPANLVRDIFYDADLAISAAGQTMAELAWCGTPTLNFAIADNQRNNAENWNASGFAMQIPLPESPNFSEELTRAVSLLRSPVVRAERGVSGQRIVDGQGAARVAKAVIAQSQSADVIVRPASRDDSLELFSLSNQNDIRSSSFSTKIIELDEHLHWITSRLADPKCLFLVAQVGRKVGGQMRFEVAGDIATISVSVQSSLRSLKLGGTLFKAGVAQLKEQYPEVKQIKALIRTENDGSIAFFSRLGFAKFDQCSINGSAALEYRYTL